MRIFRMIVYAMVAIIVLTAALTAFIVATPTGLRMGLSVAKNYLPDALELGEVSGTLAFGVVVDRAAWRDEAFTVEVRRLELELAGLPLARGDIHLDRLYATGVAVAVHPGSDDPAAEESTGPFRFRMPVPLAIGDGRLEDIQVSWPGGLRAADLISLEAEARGESLSVRRLDLQSDWLDLQADGETRFEQPYPSRLTAVWRYRVDSGLALAGSGTVAGDADDWVVEHRLLEPVVVRSKGAIRLREGDFVATLRNELESLDVQLPDEQELTAENAVVTAEGWLDGFTFAADALLQSPGLPDVRGAAGGQGTIGGIDIRRLRLTSDAGSLTAEGRLEVTARPSWDMAFRLQDLRPELWGAPMEASISARGNTTGSWESDETPRIAASLAQLDGLVRGQALTGEGDVAWAGGDGLMLEDFTLGVGENTVTATGRLGATLGLDLTIRAPQLADLWPGLEGGLAGSLDLRGDLQAPEVTADLSGSDIAWGDFAATALALTAEPLRGGGSRIDLEGRDLQIGANPVPDLVLAIDGTLSRHDVEVRAEAFDGSVSASASGGLVDSVWRGRIVELETTRPDVGRWELRDPVKFSASSSTLELQRACLAGAGERELCVAFAFDTESGATGTAQLSRLPLGVLAPFFPQESVFEGHAGAVAQFSWREGVLNGDGQATIDSGRIRARIGEDEYADLSIRTAEASARIQDNSGTVEAILDFGDQGDGQLRIATADLFEASAPIDGLLRADFRDLSMVTLLLPEFEDVRGHLMGRMVIAGTRQAPRVGGALRLREAGFLFTEAGIQITELEVVARQEQIGTIEYEGSARSGDGTVTIAGSTRRSEENGWISRLSVDGEDFEIVRLPGMQATASPELDILLDAERLELRGTVTVPRAEVTLQEAGPDAVQPSSDAVVHGRTETEAERVGPVVLVEIRATLGDEVSLQGFGLETDLTGNLRLTGGSRRPWLGFGRLSLVDARYEAYGQKLVVERGELAFTGPLDNPALDIRAVRDAGEVVAGIQIAGTVRAPSSTLFSEPPLPEAEALAYLLTGRSLERASGNDSNLLSQAALSLGLSRAGAVASQISQGVGLDTLAVEGGSEDGRLLAGKRLGEDLYLEYAWGIFDQIGSLLVRYDLSERLRLESQTGEQHSVDLIYTVEKD